MDTELIAIALDVARRGSFAAAARDRLVDPSSISRSVAALEQRLGLRLFQRSTRRLTLTEEGAAYLARAEAALEELARAGEDARAARAAPTGVLRLTASVAFGQTLITPLLPRFRAEAPDLGLELLLTDAVVDLVGERVDLAIRLAPSVGGELVAARLFGTRYRVCAAPAYLAAAGRPAEPRALADCPCIRFALPGFRTRWLFRRAGAGGAAAETISVPVGGPLVIANALALREAALQGHGPALLSDWLIRDDLAAGRLVDLFPDHDVTATEFETAAWAVYPSRSFLPHKVRFAIDLLRDGLRSAPLPG